LIKMLGGFDRPYYGISYVAPDGKMVYYATAKEKYNGEAEKYNCERFTIAKGEYLTIRVDDWRKKTATINDIFYELVKDERTDKTTPGIEWYKNDGEMLCMIKTIKQDK
jgi:predicted transcriptional regulator YdeE